MKEIIPFEAVPQIVARLEEKLDALTETVTKLFQRLYTTTGRSGGNGDYKCCRRYPTSVRIKSSRTCTGRSSALL